MVLLSESSWAGEKETQEWMITVPALEQTEAVPQRPGLEVRPSAPKRHGRGRETAPQRGQHLGQALGTEQVSATWLGRWRE